MHHRFIGQLGGLIGLTVSLPVLGQSDTGTPIETGRSYRIESRILNESRVIDVALPAGYGSNSDRRYPVVFVLDGEAEHEIAAAISRFYATMSQLPPLIVIGVRNTDRMRDMTPPPVAGFRAPPDAESAGGAERFLAFLRDELVPHVDRTYRTAPMRVLVGHSLSGLFVLHALAAQPALFTGWLAMEPSVWWNNQREFEAARAILGQPAARRARVMMVNTLPLGVDTTHWGGTRPMVRQLATVNETHGSMAMSGMMQGLRGIFADFLPTPWRAGMRPIAMLDRYDSLAQRVGYTPPVPEQTFAQVIRMSIHSRHFDDADHALQRMETARGASAESRSLREMLAAARATPQPASFVPLEVPSRRPSPGDAAAFLGRWESMDSSRVHTVEVRASGDTLVVHDRIQFPSGEWFEADDPVIQITRDGTLEWGLPFFRNIAALLVLRGRIADDGTMIVSEQVRGWVPIGPGPNTSGELRFRRVERDASPHPP